MLLYKIRHPCCVKGNSWSEIFLWERKTSSVESRERASVAEEALSHPSQGDYLGPQAGRSGKAHRSIRTTQHAANQALGVWTVTEVGNLEALRFKSNSSFISQVRIKRHFLLKGPEADCPSGALVL